MLHCVAKRRASAHQAGPRAMRGAAPRSCRRSGPRTCARRARLARRARARRAARCGAGPRRAWPRTASCRPATPPRPSAPSRTPRSTTRRRRPRMRRPRPRRLRRCGLPLWASLVTSKVLCMRRTDTVRCCGEPMPGLVGQTGDGLASRRRQQSRRGAQFLFASRKAATQKPGRRTAHSPGPAARCAVGPGRVRLHALACALWQGRPGQGQSWRAVPISAAQAHPHMRAARGVPGWHQGSRRPRNNRGQGR